MSGGYDELDRDLANEPYYPCGCHREIKFANVIQMGAVLTEGDYGPTFHLEWTCECRSQSYEHRFIVHKTAMKRLLSGLRPVVPYQAAEGFPLPLRAEQEKSLAVFRWECQQLEGVEEFLLFASRPALRALPKPPE